MAGNRRAEGGRGDSDRRGDSEGRPDPDGRAKTDSPPTSDRPPASDGRTRYALVERLRGEVPALVERLFGTEPAAAGVQVIVVDIVTHQPIQAAALPRRGKAAHRERQVIATGNLEVAVGDFNGTFRTVVAVEDGKTRKVQE